MAKKQSIIFLGKPGAGKSTQAKIIAKQLGLTIISGGDLVRAELKKTTKLAKEMKDIVSKGDLISDDVVNKLVEKKLKKHNHVLFEGFPRTVYQAKWLENKFPATNAILLDVPEKEIIRRLKHRWMVKVGSKSLAFPSKKEANAYVKENGGELFKRSDDKESIVKHRFAIYRKETYPVVKYYDSLNKLAKVQAHEIIEKTTARIVKKLL